MSARDLEVDRDQLNYQTLVEQLPGAVYRATPGASGHWSYLTQNVESLTGYSASAFARDPSLWARLIHPDDYGAVIATEERSARTGDPFLAEYRMIRPDGSIVWIRDEAITLQDESGAPVMQGVLLDITDRKHAELEMESSLSLLTATLEATADGILVVDLDGNLLGFNQRFLQLWRIPEEIARSGDDDALLAHVVNQLSDPEGFLAGVRELYAAPDADDYTLLNFADGRVYERFSTPQRVGDRPVGRVWSFRDQTEQRRSAEALRQSEERLRAIVESEPECVKLVDRDGTLVDMNPAGLRMIDAETIDQVRGLCVYDIVEPEFRDAFESLNQQVFRGEPGSLKFALRGLKGRRLIVDTHAAPFRDSHGNVIAQLAITRDITERERLEQQLRQAQKMEAIGRLAGGIAHDFNNVLTIIGNYARFLTETEAGSRRSDALEIVRASDRAAGLVRQLLAFSRKEVVQPRVLDLNAVVSDVQRLLARTIGEHIDIVVRPDKELRRIVMDPSQVEQVVLNLGLNARDAMPQGGELVLTTQNVDLVESDITPEGDLKPGPYVSLTAQDSGVGMDEEVRLHIFEPFFTTKDLGRGTGLGLASVYGIVKQAGGDVSVESERGKGTTFTVYLPCTDELATAETPVSETKPSRDEGRRVLVVEDEDAVRRLVTRILESAGYAVVSVGSAPEALEAIGSEPAFDLVVTDIVMPGMSGVELAQRIGRNDHGFKVLMMSGYAEGSVEVGDHEAAPDVLYKPFGAEDLLTKIEELLTT